MSRLSAQSIRELCQVPGKEMMIPFEEKKLVINGMSAGLSSASYDCRLREDVILGVHPGYVLRNYLLEKSDEEVASDMKIGGRADTLFGFVELRRRMQMEAECYSLGVTIEKFRLPNNVTADVADKSTYARLFISHFNTFIDPGFKGDLTLEIINLSAKPIHIKAGDPVCQVIFTWTDKPTELPYDGKYQGQIGATPAIREDK